MKLKSGREVGELKPLTVLQRIECKDAFTYKQTASGLEMRGTTTAMYLYAMHGLGFSAVQQFQDVKEGEKPYSDDEIAEIFVAVQEADQKAQNPTIKG